ncbi:glycosyltransferase family 1 protein [Natronospirillum operosum]|uniref:Glycosyltransferase family 1 protein n=1 Tax=Natronospirillum operosum TaxID=2759953 RepID=A0A4Z0W8I8_9GAMM|nr:glycosyltransferase family 4 protein [Natronospirillum operosum]TGG92105.1 glycosyltransferase family 1 protein [Natronospirillum operosum]
MAETAIPALHWLVPGDPDQWTGGHLYNQRMRRALAERGIAVPLQSLDGRFPAGDTAAARSARAALTTLEDGSIVIVDGLAYAALPEVWAEEAQRLRLLVLEHLPLAAETGLARATAAAWHRRETEALRYASGVITTSPYCARLMTEYGVPVQRIQVAEPGTDPAPADMPVDQQPGGRLQLLCVGNLIPRKGQDILLDALAQLQHLSWHCTLVGSADLAPDYARHLQGQLQSHGLQHRVALTGALPPEHLTDWYARADLLVLPSHFETYGMVITEAVRHGVPVLTTTGGALPDTLPVGAGTTVPPGDVMALQTTLAELLSKPEPYQTLRAGARLQAARLADWPQAAERFVHAVEHLLAQPSLAPAPSQPTNLQ